MCFYVVSVKRSIRIYEHSVVDDHTTSNGIISWENMRARKKKKKKKLNWKVLVCLKLVEFYYTVSYYYECWKTFD